MPRVLTNKPLHGFDAFGIGPGAPVIASYEIDNAAGVDGAMLTFVGSAVAGGTVRVLDGEVLLGTATADANGAWQFRTGTLFDGAHEFTSSVTDAAGKMSAASAVFSVMLAAQALAAAPTNASPSPDANRATLVISDTADHVINASESTDVAFTVSRLEPAKPERLPLPTRPITRLW